MNKRETFETVFLILASILLVTMCLVIDVLSFNPDIENKWIREIIRFLIFVVFLSVVFYLIYLISNLFSGIVFLFLEKKDQKTIIRDIDIKSDLLRQTSLLKDLIVKAEKDRDQDFLEFKKFVIDMLLDKDKVLEKIESQVLNVEDFNAEDQLMYDLLHTKIVDLDLSVRCLNVLNAAEISLLKDLVVLKWVEVRDFKNLGKETMREIEEMLNAKGLSFEMNLDRWIQKEITY